MSQRSRLRRRGYATAWLNTEVTIVVIVQDKMSELQRKGAGSGQLRYKVRAKSRMIYRKSNVNAPEKKGRTKFEFQQAYKPQWGIHCVGIMT